RHLLGLAGYYDFGPYLEELLNEGLVAKDGDAFYLKQLLEAENFVAAFVADRCAARPSNLTKELVAACLAKSQHELNIKYTFEQREAVFLATTSPLLIITGGPGCGKTTTIRALAAAFQAMGKVLALAAPTGKAAQRMAQLCSYPASTIHRLLKFDPRSGRFKYGINAPLCVGDADERRVEALIIDETSMVDLALAKDLFAAIPKDAHLVLVGDKDQLPSVGPGRVFAELLSTPQIKKVVLSQIFRRSDESGITTAAHSINSGIVPNIPVPDGITRSDIYLIERSDPEEAARMVENLVADQIPKKFNFSSTDITVLTPSNRGPLGTIQLNRRLQERLNPPKPNRKELEVRGEKFRLRDRVCQRVNNYQIDQEGVFNGDTGEIYTIDTQKKSMQVELWDGRLINYEGANLSQLSLCYALSVHRSQGSEMPCVVLVLHESHYSLLERQLLYTAVTRAKQLLIVVSTRKALSIATRRATTKRRCTRLQARIEALLASTDISSELEVTST
ncbi:MAG: AAA family ATPase, partial [Deltaproteobacteria bacterium]|nr:AAA family ATPase [Deltaproteobacteria bacterium]